LKYQSLQAFEKHLSEALPEHLSPVYMVGCGSDLERKKILAKIVSALEKLGPELQLSKFDASEIELSQVMETLQTRSLFSQKTAVLLDHVDALKKAELEGLSNYLSAPSKEVYLLLGAGSLKGLSDFYQKGKKELILLDLTSEKPWEKEKRLKQELIAAAFKEGKKISSDAADFLMEGTEADVGRLEQELAKVVAYVGDRNLIELKDVQAIGVSHPQQTGWEIADALVWKKGKTAFSTFQDLSGLLGVLPQVRYQLQLGMKLAEAVENGAAMQEIQSQFPTVKSLDHNLALVRRRKTVFFQKSLNLLFEIELLAKNSSFSPTMIWDIFCTKLHFYDA
jgi:DNA polymerase III delta subunit